MMSLLNITILRWLLRNPLLKGMWLLLIFRIGLKEKEGKRLWFIRLVIYNWNDSFLYKNQIFLNCSSLLEYRVSHCERIKEIINPYNPRASAKISINNIPTNTLSVCKKALTPASPQIPIAYPAALSILKKKFQEFY